MRNKFPGYCYRCLKLVETGEGHFERIPGKGWRIQHATCAIEAREAAHHLRDNPPIHYADTDKGERK
jgi:hypothetical protein